MYIERLSSQNGDTDNDAHRSKQKPSYGPANTPQHAGLMAAEVPVRCLLPQLSARQEGNTF